MTEFGGLWKSFTWCVFHLFPSLTYFPYLRVLFLFSFLCFFLFVHLLDFNTIPCFVVVVFIVCSRFPFWVSTLSVLHFLDVSQGGKKCGRLAGDSRSREKEKKKQCVLFCCADCVVI